MKLPRTLAALAIASVILGSGIFFSTLGHDGDHEDTAAVLSEQTVSEVTLEITSRSGEKSVYVLDQSGKSDAYQLLLTADENNDDLSFDFETFDFGVFITGINGDVADPAGEFWAFQINGEDSAVGVSDYVPAAGDQLGFVLEQFEI